MGRLIPDSVLWEITDLVAAATESESLTKAEALEHALGLMAERWQVPVEQINAVDDKTLYTLRSKIVRLVFPVSSFAAANLARERARGGLGFNDALELARGNAVSVAELEARPQNKQPRAAAHGVQLLTLVRAIVTAAREDGY